MRPAHRGGTGTPLPGEAIAFGETDEMAIVLSVAASLGIKTDLTERDVRVYAPDTEPETLEDTGHA